MAKTIYDVAREAGVAVSTVSRALNGSGYVSKKTMEKIEQACIGYSRTPSRLKKQPQQRTIGLIVSHDPEYFFASTFSNTMIGINAVAQEENFHLLLEISNSTERALSLFQDGLIEGAILMGAKQKDSLILSLQKEGYPFVLIGDYLEGRIPFCKVEINDYAMAKESVQHLIDLGHQHIGFIGSSLEYASCQNRLTGYYDALKEAGLQTSERDCVFCSRLTDEQVINLTKKLLYMPNRVTALLTFNDLVAYSVYKVAKEMGIRIPEGLSVVSFDDSLIAGSLSPGLTSVRQPFYDKGYQAAVRLLNQMKTPDSLVPSLTLPGLLVFRESCCPPPSLPLR